MRRRHAVATAAAVVAAGAVAIPAFAADTPSPTPTTTACPYAGTDRAGAGLGLGNGRGPGAMMGAERQGAGAQSGGRQGAGPQRGGRQGAGRQGPGAGSGMRPGMGAGMGRFASGDPLAGLTKGTLTARQVTTLAGMAEEEKLAHDVYLKLAVTSKDTRFTRIAEAETRHLAAVRALLIRYKVTDPTAGKAAGTFATVAVQRHYQDLTKRGAASLEAALAVGRDIEKTDIKDLTAAQSGLTAPDVQTVYTRFIRASQKHLRAFGG